jgi:hypothetical protein
MVEPLLSVLGYLGETPDVDRILAGTFIPPTGTDEYARKFLQELKMPESIREAGPFSNTITVEDHKWGWRRQKESTSAEPASLTFSHYKAACANDTIAAFDTDLRNLPYQYGFSPEPWQLITDVEILKKAGVYDVEKMRTITLMHAEFNMNNKKLGKDLLANAEKHAAIAPEQFGSRKKHQSIVAALNKRLTMDLLRLRRKAGALCSNDAKSCYDRIVHSIGSISMRRMGAPASAVRCMFSTLQQAAHRISTAFGLSTTTYGEHEQPPLQGAGQGNGAAPTLWAMISTPLINMMRTAGFGFQMVSGITKRAVTFVCYASVDDTDIILSLPVLKGGAQLLSAMQDFLDHWEGGLRATGGALRADKSFWYWIEFGFRNGHWYYKSKEDLPGDITIRDVDGTRTGIDRLEPHEARETLGVFLAMDGNNKVQVEELRAKANDFASCIRTGFVTATEAWIALESTIMKTLEYPMLAINLTKRQWDYIMSPVLQYTLNRAGMAKNFAHCIVYGPSKYAGFNLVHPYFKQHYLQLAATAEHLSRPGITGDLLWANFEQLRIESGLPSHLDGDWQLGVSKQYLTDCWLKSLLCFCEEQDLSFRDPCGKLEPRTSRDRYLMEAFMNYGYRNAELRKLNFCRMHLKVITLSDIVSADLSRVEKWAWKGDSSMSTRNFEWPASPPRIPKSFWTLWQQALEKCFLQPNSPGRTIRVDLGTWLPTAFDEWQWWYCSEEDRLYTTVESRHRYYSKLPTRTRRNRFNNNPYHTTVMPDNLLPATVEINSSSITMTAHVTDMPLPFPEPDIHSFTDAVEFVNHSDKWAISHLHAPDEGRQLAQSIQQQTAIAVSDGSYADDVGTAGFLLHQEGDRSQAVVGVNLVPGNANEQSAYRAELAGIVGILVTLQIVCTFYNITEGSISIGLDGEMALKQAETEGLADPSQADFDLINDIRKKVQQLPITIRWRWIKGHQDDRIPFDQLDEPAQDNVIADTLAKKYRRFCLRNRIQGQPLILASDTWSLHLRGHKLSHIDSTLLYEDACRDSSTKYWLDKFSITTTTETVDWEGCKQAFKTLPFFKKKRVLKHASGNMGVGAVLLQRKSQDHDECPACDLTETPKHILQCADPRAQPVWEKAINSLSASLLKIKTDPRIVSAISSELNGWRLNSSPDITSESIEVRAAILSQRELGWYPALFGFLSTQWAPLQQAYYTWLNSRRTGKRWVSQLIILLHNVSWDMWTYRNGLKHSGSSSASKQARAALESQVSDQYHLGYASLLASDRHWLSKPLPDLLKLDDSYLRQWLASITLARNSFHNFHLELSESVRRQQELLARWLSN